MSGEGFGHGTGYEDAISRRIAGLEAESSERAERLERATATVEELTRDNARLRVRAHEAEARARRMGLFVVLAALAALGVLAAAAYFLLVTPGR